MPKKTLYTDRDYLEEKFARIEQIILPLVDEVNELKAHKTRAEGFITGAKWFGALVLGVISVGLVKIGLGGIWDVTIGNADVAHKP